MKLFQAPSYVISHITISNLYCETSDLSIWNCGYSVQVIVCVTVTRGYLAKLPQQIYERSLSKRVGDASVERHRWVFCWQNGNPLLLKIKTWQIKWDVRQSVLICMTLEGRKEGNVLFKDTLNTFYLRLYGIRQMVKDHSAKEETRCCHMGYSFQLAARVLLYASSHRQDSTYHSLC